MKSKLKSTLKSGSKITKKVGGEEVSKKESKEEIRQADKHNIEKSHNKKTVGVNIGLTLNMENYESLRIDCWATDEVKENETLEDALDRVRRLVQSKVEEYSAEVR